jgi:hypothetical protein
MILVEIIKDDLIWMHTFGSTIQKMVKKFTIDKEDVTKSSKNSRKL